MNRIWTERWLGLAACTALWGVPGCSADKTVNQEALRIDLERFRVNLFPEEHALGAEQPLVTIVIFSDYACAPCKKTWDVMDHLLEHYPNDLRVVHRSVIVPGHGQGERAAEAVMAAGEQGKFWEMHRRLFQHQTQFDRPVLRAHAESIGLDVPKFLDDVETGAGAGTLIRHKRQATTFGVQGAPISFVNGLMVMGFKPEEAWRGVVEAEIQRAKDMMAHGTSRSAIYKAFMEGAQTKRISETKDAEQLRDAVADAQKAVQQVTIQAPRGDKLYAVTPGDEAATMGPADAPVTIVEFLDFECPYCRKMWDEGLAKVLPKHKKDVRFSIRQLPLEIHPTAQGAARAAVAAGRQGKFWEMHDKLMAERGSGAEVYAGYAAALGLDVEQFKKDLEDPSTAAAVKRDQTMAKRLGVTGTPALFINGRYISGFQSEGAIEAHIKDALADVDKRVKEGADRAQIFETIMKEAVQEADFPNPA